MQSKESKGRDSIARFPMNSAQSVPLLRKVLHSVATFDYPSRILPRGITVGVQECNGGSPLHIHFSLHDMKDGGWWRCWG